MIEDVRTSDCLHVVASGWLRGSVRLADGGRRILRFYFLGDITAIFSVALGIAATLTTVSDCTFYEVPRAALGRLLRDHPRLGAFAGVLAYATRLRFQFESANPARAARAGWRVEESTA